jgi:hypothetical protein
MYDMSRILEHSLEQSSPKKPVYSMLYDWISKKEVLAEGMRFELTIRLDSV